LDPRRDHGGAQPWAAVLLVSKNLDELLGLSDRLVVMFHGKFVQEARACEADLTETGRHMAGQDG
jgi:general nucleoside transport system ATP-binding protein